MFCIALPPDLHHLCTCPIKKTTTSLKTAETAELLSGSVSNGFLYCDYFHPSSQFLPSFRLPFFSCQSFSSPRDLSFVYAHFIFVLALPSNAKMTFSSSLSSCRHFLYLKNAAAVRLYHRETVLCLFIFHFNLKPSLCNLLKWFQIT